VNEYGNRSKAPGIQVRRRGGKPSFLRCGCFIIFTEQLGGSVTIRGFWYSDEEQDYCLMSSPFDPACRRLFYWANVFCFNYTKGFVKAHYVKTQGINQSHTDLYPSVCTY